MSSVPGPALTGISSMATRQVLDALAQAYEARTGTPVRITSIGGVDAAKRVAAGEAFDCVVLADQALTTLQTAGHVVAGSIVPLLRSAMALAVRSGAPRPDLSTEQAFRAALVGATRIGYSTGPSGNHLQRLLRDWNLSDTLGPRLIQAPPGVPVARLIAQGDVDVGLQQTSELIGVEGVDVVGPLPGSAALVTIFAAGICTTAQQPEATRALLDFLRSEAADPIAEKLGMAVVREAA